MLVRGRTKVVPPIGDCSEITLKRAPSHVVKVSVSSDWLRNDTQGRAHHPVRRSSGPTSKGMGGY